MNSVYNLNSGNQNVESQRLEAQHDFLRQLTKVLLPEKVKSHLLSLDRAPAIADIACGTGVWLRDLASEMPAASRLRCLRFRYVEIP